MSGPCGRPIVSGANSAFAIGDEAEIVVRMGVADMLVERFLLKGGHLQRLQ